MSQNIHEMIAYEVLSHPVMEEALRIFFRLPTKRAAKNRVARWQLSQASKFTMLRESYAWSVLSNTVTFSAQP